VRRRATTRMQTRVHELQTVHVNAIRGSTRGAIQPFPSSDEVAEVRFNHDGMPHDSDSGGTPDSRVVWLRSPEQPLSAGS
jgi:hypothetical protein